MDVWGKVEPKPGGFVAPKLRGVKGGRTLQSCGWSSSVGLHWKEHTACPAPLKREPALLGHISLCT